MGRCGFKMKLIPGCEDECLRRHNSIWPDLLKLLNEQVISNYSIFFDKETNILFVYHEQCGSESSQDLGNEEMVKKWWNYMKDIMETNPDNSPVTKLLEEVFHMK
jgi:L-rhamnose mutarotase